MSTLVSIASGNPSGTGAAIPIPCSATAAGDFVILQFGWGRSGVGLHTTISDPLGNTWTVVDYVGNSNEAGGYAYSLITTGWSGTNTITATLSTGVPGGRVFQGWKIPSGTLAASPVDQHVESGTASDPTNTPSVTSGTLAQANSLCVGLDLQRSSSGTAALTWDAGWTSDGSQTGVGTPASGVFAAEQTVASTAAVTASGVSANTTDHHEIGILVLKLAGGSPIVLNAPTATVAAGGLVGQGAEIASAPKASVSATGLLPLGRIICQAPLATVIAHAFDGHIPAPPTIVREWNLWWKPVPEILFSKWGGFVRD